MFRNKNNLFSTQCNSSKFEKDPLPSFEFEEHLVRNGQLTFTRRNKYLISHHLWSGDPNLSNEDYIHIGSKEKWEPGARLKASDAEYWYRAMNKIEFDYLKRNYILLIEGSSYMGITANMHYAAKYMENNLEYTHLIKFTTQTNLHKFFQQALDRVKIILDPKAEGGGTYGLGMTGGSLGVLGEHFNDLLAKKEVTWKLVAWNKGV